MLRHLTLNTFFDPFFLYSLLNTHFSRCVFILRSLTVISIEFIVVRQKKTAMTKNKHTHKTRTQSEKRLNAYYEWNKNTKVKFIMRKKIILL